MSEFGEPEAFPDDYGEDAGGDELGLVAKYFPESSPAPAESWTPDDEAPPSPAGAEMALLEEYRQQGFDAGAVEEVRDVDAEIASMSDDELDEELAAYYSEDGDDYGEPDAEGLIDLGDGEAATAEEWAASMERQGITPEMLVEAWAAEHPNERLMQNWMHLNDLNQVLADQEAQQAAQADQQFAEAESVARDLISAENRKLGNLNGDADVALRVADATFTEMVQGLLDQGYPAEQVEAYQETLAKAAIERACEQVRDAHVHANALKRV